MKFKVQHKGKEIEVDIDLAAHQLVPASRITEESDKRRAAETQLQALQKELGVAKSALDLSGTRLRLAGDAAPSEAHAKMARGAYQGFTDGMEKPPTFEEWSSTEGKSFLASLRPAAAPAPAGAPTPAPAPTPAAPAPAPAIPNTSAGALTTPPAAPSKEALFKQYNDLNQQYARANQEGRKALAPQIAELEGKIRAPVGAAT